MRVVLQRVKYAKCVVDGKITGSCENGYMLLVGYTHSDTDLENAKMAKKICNLRVFEDDQGKMNLNISQVGGSILSISQFTLYANPNEGNRPSFTNAMEPKKANELYLKFNEELRKLGLHVEEGIFGAHMEISLLNDGPVTIQLEF